MTLEQAEAELKEMHLLAYLGCIILGASIGLFLAALLTANPMSELRDEVHELRRRLSECTCREGA